MNYIEKKITLLKVPIHNFHYDDFDAYVRNRIESGQLKHIVFLSLWDFFKARRNNKFRNFICSADLCIPTSKLLVFAAKTLESYEITRYMPFDFIIKLLGALETQSKSVYLLGSKPAIMQISAQNLRVSFPKLNIVGRHAANYTREEEADILTVIKKSSPTLLLAGKGVKGKALWLKKHEDTLNANLALWSSDCYEVFAGKKRKPSKEAWEKGTHNLFPNLFRPWKIIRIFQIIYFLMLVLVKKIINHRD